MTKLNLKDHPLEETLIEALKVNAEQLAFEFSQPTADPIEIAFLLGITRGLISLAKLYNIKIPNEDKLILAAKQTCIIKLGLDPKAFDFSSNEEPTTNEQSLSS